MRSLRMTADETQAERLRYNPLVALRVSKPPIQCIEYASYDLPLCLNRRLLFSYANLDHRALDARDR